MKTELTRYLVSFETAPLNEKIEFAKFRTALPFGMLYVMFNILH